MDPRPRRVSNFILPAAMATHSQPRYGSGGDPLITCLSHAVGVGTLVAGDGLVRCAHTRGVLSDVLQDLVLLPGPVPPKKGSNCQKLE